MGNSCLSGKTRLLSISPEQLLLSDTRLHTLAHVKAPLCILDVDAMRVLWANAAGLEFWCARSEQELYERDVTRGLSKTVVNRVLQIRTDCHDNDVCLTEFWNFHLGEQTRNAQMSLSPYCIGDTCRALLVEIVDSYKAANSETLHTATALLHTATMISLYSVDYKLLYCNPAARAVLTHHSSVFPDRLVNTSDLRMIEIALAESDSCTMELEVHTTQGPRWHNMNIQRSLDAATGQESLLVSATDETERRYAQQKAYNLAYTDSLTRLPNRAAMNMYLDELLSIEEQALFSLFFLDLDRFKAINDSLGHAAGDELLVEVAQRLKKSGGSNSLVARMGGDEFVMVINRVVDIKQLRIIANGVIESMSKSFTLAGQKLRVLPSIGIACFPENGASIAQLMQNADAAMYLAKANQSGYCFYDEKMTASLNQNIKNRLELENDLVAAIQNHEFELYYQPKISCQNLKAVGVEALIRWNHPTRGMVPPNEFIGIAEETGQIIELGNWVLGAAMQQQKSWTSTGLLIPVSINISARQFKATDLITHVSEALISTGCDPAMIELEITESMLLGDADKVHETLHQLSAMGMELALDDFGTGYSNLAYLQKYPLDTLKIDRAFLADQKRSMLMGTILSMGKVLGLTIVAEGIENASQADWLIARGCDQMQGFYFSRPLPVAEATEFLKTNGCKQIKPSANKAA